MIAAESSAPADAGTAGARPLPTAGGSPAPALRLHQQILRFILIGGAATALHYGILIALVQAAVCEPVLATSIGFGISAIANYLVNGRFTFRSKVSHRTAFPRFATVAVGGLALNALLMWAFHNWLNVQYLVAQLGATAITLIWNFLLNKVWTFSGTSPDRVS